MVEDRRSQLNIVAEVLLSLTWVFFSQRICIRLFVTKSWKLDDTLLLIAQLSFTAYLVSAFIGIAAGTGGPVQDITVDKAPRALFTWWLCEILYDFTTLSVRLSIAVFLLTICMAKYQRWILYATMGVILVYSLAFLFTLTFQCNPVSHFWNRYNMETAGHCINPNIIPRMTIGHSTISAICDFVLGGLPIIVVARMTMQKRKKVAMAAILAITVLAGVATIIRIPYIRVLHISRKFLNATADVGIWSAVECAIGIIAASSFTISAFVRWCRARKQELLTGGQNSRTTRRPSHFSHSRLSRLYHRKRYSDATRFYLGRSDPRISASTANVRDPERPSDAAYGLPSLSVGAEFAAVNSRSMSGRPVVPENSPSATISRPDMIARMEENV
ncbi:hypothetical protein F5884DRAFT_851807 [Xylogone sp. PMI_703]|nr:hypothetical protein F5884DRAFT_851807 [Xylogone sp. PMI_703]